VSKNCNNAWSVASIISNSNIIGGHTQQKLNPKTQKSRKLAHGINDKVLLNERKQPEPIKNSSRKKGGSIMRWVRVKYKEINTTDNWQKGLPLETVQKRTAALLRDAWFHNNSSAPRIRHRDQLPWWWAEENKSTNWNKGPLMNLIMKFQMFLTKYKVTWEKLEAYSDKIMEVCVAKLEWSL